MRETISIDKNFLNNEEIITTKQKPNSRTRGKVTIGLYDEKGNIQREIKTENIVYDWVKAYSFKNNYFKNFGLGTMGGFNNNSICTQTHRGVLPLSKYLMLFNGEHEDTNPKKSLIKDDMVGFAGRYEEYSGNSTTKGTYNTAESTTSIDDEGNIVFHMVYDFPTHSANGTITGIGLGHTTERNKELIPYNIKKINPTSPGINTYTTSAVYNKDMDMFMGVFNYYSSGYQSFEGVRCRDLEDDIIKRRLVASDNALSFVPTEYSSSLSHNAYMGIEEKTENILVSYVSTSTYVIAKTNGVSNPPIHCGNTVKVSGKIINKLGEATKIEKTLGFDFSSLLNLRETVTISTSYKAEIYVSPFMHKDKFIVYVRTAKSTYLCNDTTDKSYLLVFDLEGNYEKHIDISNLSSLTSCKIIPYGEDEFLIPLGKGNFVKGDTSLSSVEKISIDDLNIYHKDKIDLDVLKEVSDGNLWVGNYNKKIVLHADKASSFESYYKLKDDRINLSSYTRLPSPITKTNIHTMKVQYDIVIEDISIYDYIEY